MHDSLWHQAFAAFVIALSLGFGVGIPVVLLGWSCAWLDRVMRGREERNKHGR